MITIRNQDYPGFAERIKKDNKKIVVYGAGVIGKVLVPYIVHIYELHNYIDCYVDADSKLTGESVLIDGHSYEIRAVSYLDKMRKDDVLLITNSKFYEVIDSLDKIPALNYVESYIVPIMQLNNICKSNSDVDIVSYDKIQIPKVINYCWFGGKEIPDFLKKCISSWEKYCPDYEIKCWDESNYDVNKHIYTKQAYESKRYGFVTDLARFDILYENGGLYFDTDVELIRGLDDLLRQEGFVATEKWGNINSGGGCGFVKNHPLVKKLLEYRSQQRFMHDDGTINTSTNGLYETKIFNDNGYVPNGKMQKIASVTVYPPLILHPYDYMSGKLELIKESVSIHHFYGGWMDDDDRKNRARTQENYKVILNRIEGNE